MENDIYLIKRLQTIYMVAKIWNGIVLRKLIVCEDKFILVHTLIETTVLFLLYWIYEAKLVNKYNIVAYTVKTEK